MIRDFNYHQTDPARQRWNCLEYLAEKKFDTVIDIGYLENNWSTPWVTHYVNLPHMNDTTKHDFIGNISQYDVWDELLKYVEEHGKFDFAICTHTLEDISSPQLVCELLPRIAKEGYIAVPSKYRELVRWDCYSIGSEYQGLIHHRWVFNKEGDSFVGYPKVPLLEYMDFSSFENLFHLDDLNFLWTDEFELKIVNNDMLGPTSSAVRDMYQPLLQYLDDTPVLNGHSAGQMPLSQRLSQFQPK